MNNQHVLSRMAQRGLAYDINRLQNIAAQYSEDTAVILGKMASDENLGMRPVMVLVILIVRNKRPITIMTRRESQNFTKANFNVQKIVRL